MKGPLTGLILAAGLSLAAGAASADDVSANLRLMAFGSDAQLTAVKHAVGRFNQKYPNVKVEIAIDPITNGWGDYVTHVLSQFNANNAYDVYGTAIETFRTFETRGMFIPLDDYIAKNPSYSDFDPSLFKYSSYQGKTYFIPIGWNNIMINYNRTLVQGRRRRLSEGLDLGPIPRGRQEADQARRGRQRDPVRLRGARTRISSCSPGSSPTARRR